MKTPALVFAFLICLSCSVLGQENDTTLFFLDSLETVSNDLEFDDEEEEENYNAPNDTLKIESRTFDHEALKKLKEDSDLDYKQPPTVAESLWDRFWRWIGEMLDFGLEQAFTTNLGRVIMYAIGLTLIIIIVMMLLKVNAFKVLYSGQGASQTYQIVEENIHEMDFDKLIQEANQQQDYRRGIRLLFLYALKLLSDRELIHWEMGKTNHDYQRELTKTDLRSGFNDLSFYFEYAWYGNFGITQETFQKAKDIFTVWKSRLN